MRQRLRRLVAVMVGLLAAMALAGCDVTGTMKVRADDQVELDLRVVVEDEAPCFWQISGDIRTGERRIRGGGRLCLLEGTVPKDTLSRWGVHITHVGEHIEAVYNPLGVADVANRLNPVPLTDVAVEVEFPGEVRESTGIVEGTTVRFTDVAQLSKPSGMRVLALDHRGPPLSLVFPVVAFAVGALTVAALWAAARRRLLIESAGLQRFFGAAPTSAGQGAAVATDAPAVYHHPGSLLPDDLRGHASPAGPDGWQRPADRPDDPPRTTGPPPSPNAKWAPPEGPG